MKFLSVAVLIASGITLAAATDYKPCQSTIYSSPQCCATDALGIIGIDCKVPNFPPLDPGHFRRICAESGQQAKCCVLPVADQAVLCDNPVGLN